MSLQVSAVSTSTFPTLAKSFQMPVIGKALGIIVCLGAIIYGWLALRNPRAQNQETASLKTPTIPKTAGNNTLTAAAVEAIQQNREDALYHVLFFHENGEKLSKGNLVQIAEAAQRHSNAETFGPWIAAHRNASATLRACGRFANHCQI